MDATGSRSRSYVGSKSSEQCRLKDNPQVTAGRMHGSKQVQDS
jgi:hypothetical protein